MGIAYMEQIRGHAYMTRAKLAQEFQCCDRTVDKRIKEIREEIKSGRYSKYAILDGDTAPLVNAYVYIDYIKYRKALRNRNTRKYVPPFEEKDMKEIAGLCGYCSMSIREVI